MFGVKTLLRCLGWGRGYATGGHTAGGDTAAHKTREGVQAGREWGAEKYDATTGRMKDSAQAGEGQAARAYHGAVGKSEEELEAGKAKARQAYEATAGQGAAAQGPGEGERGGLLTRRNGCAHPLPATRPPELHTPWGTPGARRTTAPLCRGLPSFPHNIPHVGCGSVQIIFEMEEDYQTPVHQPNPRPLCWCTLNFWSSWLLAHFGQ